MKGRLNKQNDATKVGSEAQMKANLQQYEHTDRSNENGTLTMKPYVNEVTLRG